MWVPLLMKGKIIYFDSDFEVFRYIHIKYEGIMLRWIVFGYAKLL